MAVENGVKAAAHNLVYVTDSDMLKKMRDALMRLVNASRTQKERDVKAVDTGILVIVDLDAVLSCSLLFLKHIRSFLSCFIFS